MNSVKIVKIASGFLGLAVIIGAFGAHGLKDQLTGQSLETFKTGVSYQFYHGFAILMCALLQQSFKNRDLKNSVFSFAFGIFFFSFNCYLYAILKIKIFALLVPIGGLAFIAGWCFLFIEFKKRVS